MPRGAPTDFKQFARFYLFPVAAMTQIEDEIVLVDDLDRIAGYAPKLKAHQAGLRHRAISVCLIDRDGRMLLQRRAAAKYHSGGLWSNACCTHPKPLEQVANAASRRLFEEMGIRCPLFLSARTLYCADVGNGLIENEFVHIFTGVYDGVVNPNPIEVAEVAWRSYDEISRDLSSKPLQYSVWFRHYMHLFAKTLFYSGSKADLQSAIDKAPYS